MRAGDPAPDGSGPLELARGIEMGHIFQLGRKYAEALDLKVLDENGKLVTVTMGSYGVGVSRAVAAVAEYAHDEAGLVWPKELAPFDVHLIVAGKDEAVVAGAEQVYADLVGEGFDVLFDDRLGKVSPGVKFKDAELIGVPTIVVVGKGLVDGVVEVKDRATGDQAPRSRSPTSSPPSAPKGEPRFGGFSPPNLGLPVGQGRPGKAWGCAPQVSSARAALRQAADRVRAQRVLGDADQGQAGGADASTPVLGQRPEPRSGSSADPGRRTAAVPSGWAPSAASRVDQLVAGVAVRLERRPGELGRDRRSGPR